MNWSKKTGKGFFGADRLEIKEICSFILTREILWLFFNLLTPNESFIKETFFPFAAWIISLITLFLVCQLTIKPYRPHKKLRQIILLCVCAVHSLGSVWIKMNVFFCHIRFPLVFTMLPPCNYYIVDCLL